MDEPLLRFVVPGAQPDTLPLPRLLDYLTEVGRLVGQADALYLVGIEAGSAVATWRPEAAPSVPVGIDSSVLCLWLNPQARPPLDPQTGQPVARAAERVAELCRQLLEQREAIIVPAPVVAEVLSAALLAADAVQSAIDRLFGLRVEPFDLKAAIELARLTRDVRAELAWH